MYVSSPFQNHLGTPFIFLMDTAWLWCSKSCCTHAFSPRLLLMLQAIKQSVHKWTTIWKAPMALMKASPLTKIFTLAKFPVKLLFHRCKTPSFPKLLFLWECYADGLIAFTFDAPTWLHCTLWFLCSYYVHHVTRLNINMQCLFK